MISLGGVCVRLEEEVDEQPLDRRPVVADLVVARSAPTAHARAGSACSCRRAARSPCAWPRACRRGSRAPGRGAAGRGRPGPRSRARCRTRAGPPSPRACARPAPGRGRHRSRRRTVPTRPIARSVAPSSSAAGIRGDLAAVERGHHLAALDHFITEQVAATLCRHRGTPLRRLSLCGRRVMPDSEPRCTYSGQPDRVRCVSLDGPARPRNTRTARLVVRRFVLERADTRDHLGPRDGGDLVDHQPAGARSR